MTDETRRTRRRRLLLLGLLPLLLALAFSAKVGWMLVMDRDGRASYADAQWDAARGSFAANTTLNVLEPWVAPFGEGTARYRSEDFRGAVRALETALLDVPPAEECRVRINLSLAHEAVGDGERAGGDVAAARTAYQAGVVALADCLGLGKEAADTDAEEPEASKAALPATAEVGGARVGDARAVDTRLREKLRQARDADRPDQAPTEQQGQLDERNQQGEDQRDKSEQRQQDEAAEQAEQEQQEQQQPTQAPTGTGEEPPPPVYEW